ncbi:transglutaminase domain-containing protein [Stenotrophomonas sp. 278]|uniref:transglutaminase-like domain-containing protein n=1 Tax=Stenotrophomonas sp. 278 TaxID=2479851 RepID=UPI0021AD8B27|nr:transglutaminase domain-containing protein [Stenotrophomonas sp. 278]
MESAVRKPHPLRRFAWHTAACLLLVSPALCAQPVPALPDLIASIDAGHFVQADADITRALADANLSQDQRDAYAFQRERMRRILLDFTLDAAAAQAQVRKQIPDLTADEFARWDAQGYLEHLDIDGERRWFKRAPSNLFRVSAEARARRAPGVPVPKDGPYEVVGPHHEEVVAAARSYRPTVDTYRGNGGDHHSAASTTGDRNAGSPRPLVVGPQSLTPRHVTVTQSLTVKPDAVPAGETIRAWIPYPRAIPGQQENIRFLGSSGGTAPAQIAREDTQQRSAYLQAPAVAGQPTQFEVRYELTVYARHTDIDPAKVQPTPNDPALQPYLAERAPHVVFTPALRAFSQRVVGNETHPYRIFEKLFDAVDQIPWGGAREYSTISNISNYALHAGHADCGQQTLLLIALLRLNGIPARWQSGMVYSDDSIGYNNLHDWGAVYLAPYGWVPMDVTTGRLHSRTPALRDFYLGGLDAYRIAFNDDYDRPLVPAKKHPRSDTVDNQRGEVEWSGGNLYYDQWTYDFQSHMK